MQMHDYKKALIEHGWTIIIKNYQSSTNVDES